MAVQGRRRHKKWLPAEIDRLLAFREQIVNQEITWLEVARAIGNGRTPADCRLKAKKLDPTFTQGQTTERWTEKEDVLLMELVSKATSSRDWEYIASNFTLPPRSAVACSSRAEVLYKGKMPIPKYTSTKSQGKPRANRFYWTKDKDDRLRSFEDDYRSGAINYVGIAKALGLDPITGEGAVWQRATRLGLNWERSTSYLKWEEKDIARLSELLDQGKNLEEIAFIMKRELPDVKSQHRRIAVEDTQQWTEEQNQVLISLLREGKSYVEAARAMNRSPAAVFNRRAFLAEQKLIPEVEIDDGSVTPIL